MTKTTTDSSIDMKEGTEMEHLYPPNDIYDVVRLICFFVSLYTVVLMIVRFQDGGRDWNVKTKDSWYALLMWACAGCVLSAQGILLDRPFTPGFVLTVAAILVSGKAVHRKGDWGRDAK